MNANLSNFEKEYECIYKEECYSVRDNGAVKRHARKGKQLRQLDDQWTFGKPNEKTGYAEIASVRVHRIVATAFHGEPPTKEHVVDHVDTNKQNNRPENLRWVTRLENILLNPITAKRIALVCGSVEAFLEDPSKFREKFGEPNYAWMCTVSKQEAQISLKRMQAWALSSRSPIGGMLGDWIFNRSLPDEEPTPVTIKAITPHAIQKNWNTPSEFPCCPQQIGEQPILNYAESLVQGAVFCRNNVYGSFVVKKAVADDERSIYVITKSSGLKPWALAKITFESGLFVHENLGTFFKQDGVEKYYTLAQGLEWAGGDTFDDNC